MHGVRHMFESLPIRLKLLAIAITAVLPVLVLAAAFMFNLAGGPFVPVAIGAALAGVVLSALVQGMITRPLDRLQQSIEEREIARHEAETASQAKSEFLANMSHELRQPLNAIIGFSELMKSETFGPIGNPTYVEYAADINFSGTHLLEIINDILDVVRHESGKLELKEEVVDVDEVINEALRLVAPQALHGRVQLEWRPPAPSLPALFCDRVRLRQMLLNILSNAVKFTRPGGSIEIGAEVADGLHFIVMDTGIGIRIEDIGRIMNPFVQVASAYPRDHQGTGLGLTLTKALIERHGGSLSLDSTPGVGTTVRLSFPAERVVRSPDEPEGTPGQSASS
jgi:signal transduction histidine kinase